MSSATRINVSYKDPHTVVFKSAATIYRQLHKTYQPHYEKFIQSGLYDKLLQKGFVIPHEEVSTPVYDEATHFKTIRPQQISFITHPAEWSFTQWKDAALHTLEILTESLAHGMILKDATPFNMQMVNGSMRLIDTGSFISYEANTPWIAYRQFCESFLGPLLLMHYNYAEAGKLFLLYPDGIPVKQLTRLLPFKARFNMGALMHIYFQASFKGSVKQTQTPHQLKQQNLLAIADNLKGLIKKLEPRFINFDWDLYYQSIWVEDDYIQEKETVFNRFVQQLQIKSAIDMGCNTGMFSKILAGQGIEVVAVDSSTSAVDQLYQEIKRNKLSHITTCVQDITDPTPATGLLNKERESFLQRGSYDLVIGFALIHHICIAKNIPLAYFVSSLAAMGRYIITEFVPKSDSNVQLMLKNREDIFDNYTQAHFEAEVNTRCRIMQQHQLNNGRILYLLEVK